MLINVSRFLLQPDHLLLVILLRNRRRKLAQLTEKKRLLHNCNFMRKTVTQPPRRSLRDDVNQAISKDDAPSNAGVKVWAEEPNKKGALGEYSREDISRPCSYSFPFFPLSQVHWMKIYWENASRTQEFPLWCLDLKSTFFPHVFSQCYYIIFPGKAYKNILCLLFAPTLPRKREIQESHSFGVHTCPPNLGGIPTDDSGASEDRN